MKISVSYSKIARSRAIIENITPRIEDGAYAVKRTIGESLIVEADVFADGHDRVEAILLFRTQGNKKWEELPMQHIDNDRWKGEVVFEETGHFEYTVKAFIDHPATWQYDFRKRLVAKEEKELLVQLQIGAQYIEAIAKKYAKAKKEAGAWIRALSGEHAFDAASGKDLEEFFRNWPLVQNEITFSTIYEVVVHRKKAGFSAWYSFFSRSAAKEGSDHGTFDDCIDLLPRIKELGFDVVYFPPIHPIGHAFRKGKNNSLDIQPGEPGCPYATGNELGGHKDILPELGSLEDFKRFIAACNELEIEVALDFAIQCSPDHPYVKEHPQWFKWRPDGTVQYAENPPKKYQDVLPLDYENEDWQNMWFELKGILEYWISQGVQIFRVDNPHTKSFVFWQWCLEEIDRDYPDVLFLSEAFTRPRVMENLAKKGFHQSYTYYTWRNNKAELQGYMRDLTQTSMREYFRPNFWPNTHDINPYILQSGHEPQYILRFFLASTLSSNYGVFGPCFELMEHDALPGKEEYLNSEKYEVRHWNWEHRNKLMRIMTLVNKARNENAALQYTNNYSEAFVTNDHIMAWVKVHGDSKVVCVANLDAWHRQSGMLSFDPAIIGKSYGQSFTVHDLISGEKYTWSGGGNFVDLDPYRMPFHLFRIED